MSTNTSKEIAILTAIDRRVNRICDKDILVRIDGEDRMPSRLTDHDIEVVDASYYGDPRTTSVRFVEATKWIVVVVGPYDI